MQKITIESETENVSELVTASDFKGIFGLGITTFTYTYGILNRTVQFQYERVVEQTSNKLVLAVDWIDLSFNPEAVVRDLQQAFKESHYDATVTLGYL